MKVTLKGEKHRTDKKDLFTLATRILDNKLHLLDGLANGQNFLQYAAYRDNMKNNQVEAIARIKHVGKPNEWKLWNVPGRGLGEPLDLAGYDKEAAQSGRPSATVAGLFAQILQEPCHPASLPQTAPRDTTTPSAEPLPATVDIYEGNLDNYSPDYSSEHLNDGLYSDYVITSEIKTQTGYVDLPIGDSAWKMADKTVIVLPLHRGWARREVRITAERLLAWPEMPDWSDFVDDNGIVHTVLDHRQIPSAPCLSADGKKSLFRFDQEMLFSLSRPPALGEDLPVGKLPYRSNTSDTLYHSVLGSSFKAHGDIRGII